MTAHLAQYTDLFVDYIFLDTEERRKMAQSSHEYLVTQLQYQEYNKSGYQMLNFNHPCKELIFKTKETNGTTSKVVLTLNGHERMAPRDWKYFNKGQPYQHHTSIPTSNNIGVYSFSLKPEENQPSGSCNFSRIDNALLQIGDSSEGIIWATNWNILRIMSGMGGLAYSN